MINIHLNDELQQYYQRNIFLNYIICDSIHPLQHLMFSFRHLNKILRRMSTLKLRITFCD